MDKVDVAPLKSLKRLINQGFLYTDFDLQQVLFKLLSIVSSTGVYIEYNSYIMITWDMTKYTHPPLSAAHSREVVRIF